MTSIVNSAAYRSGQSVGEISIAQISDFITQPDTFAWLGLHEPDDALLLKIQGAFGLHQLAIEDAHHAHQRPKLEAYSNSLFIVLKTAQLERGEVGTKGLHKGPGFALYAVLDFVADHYQPIVAKFEQDFEAIETDIFSEQFDRLAIERLYHLKRQMLELRNAALPVADISAV